MSLIGPRAVGALLRQAFLCPTCGKSRLILNTAGYRQRPQMEAFDPERHCTCPPPQIEGERQKGGA